MERKMDYVSFQVNMKKKLTPKLPEGHQIVIQQVRKNNDILFDSLTILSESVNISPNFYLQQYYKRYLAGESTEALIAEIWMIFEQTREGMDPYNLDLSFSACRDKIVYRLISAEKNRRRLQHAPWIPFLDLVITFHVVLLEQEDSMGSVLIHDDLLDQWQVDTKQLLQLAQENTMRLFPLQVCPMEQMLQDMLKNKEDLLETDGILFQSGTQAGCAVPLVVTNEKGINGAAVLLYPGCLSLLSEQCQGDYYILPSSIHELLVLPDQSLIPEKELEKMVQEVNENCVQPDEILSGHIYHYSAQLGTVELVTS